MGPLTVSFPTQLTGIISVTIIVFVPTPHAG